MAVDVSQMERVRVERTDVTVEVAMGVSVCIWRGNGGEETYKRHPRGISR